jgi:hypothetical protein
MVPMNITVSKWRIYLDLSLFSITEETNHDPWDISSDKIFRWEFRLIPDDVEFWNHVLWVIPNPELVKKLMPPYLEVIQSGERYFVFEKIPF